LKNLWVNFIQVSVEFQDVHWDAVDDAYSKAVEDSFQKLAEEIEWKWRQKASIQLHTSRQQYLDGLHVDYSHNEITASLTGWLPVAVEQGTQGFDMTKGLLGGALHRTIGIEKAKSGHLFNEVGQGSTWWHPGILARRIHKQVEREVPGMLSDILVPSISRISV